MLEVKIRIISVGTNLPKWVQQGYQEYNKRLPDACKVELIEVPLAKRTKNILPTKTCQDEARRMLNHISPDSHVIALEVTGKSLATRQLASKIQDWQFAGKTINLLIGGPDGLGSACSERADTSWSLSALTLPHPIVRIIVIEQLYRAFTILQGHPYHRD